MRTQTILSQIPFESNYMYEETWFIYEYMIHIWRTWMKKLDIFCKQQLKCQAIEFAYSKFILTTELLITEYVRYSITNL